MASGRGWLLGSKCVQCGHSWSTGPRARLRCPRCRSRRWALEFDLERAVAFRTPYTITRLRRRPGGLVEVELRSGPSPERSRIELEGLLGRQLRANARALGLTFRGLLGCDLMLGRTHEGGTEITVRRQPRYDLGVGA